MKKIFASILIIIIFASFAACNDSGSQGSENSPNVTVSGDTQSQSSDNKELSVESLMSASATSASSFNYEVIDGKLTITKFIGDETIVVIPDIIESQKVEVIGDYSFANQEEIVAVKLNDSVISVGDNAFENCYAMEVFVSGDSLAVLGRCAFNFCTSLREIKLNEGLETMEFGCFGMTKLNEAYIPESVTSISMGFLIDPDYQDNFVIKGKAGSYAEQYAKDNNYKFEAI